ncbi:MAG: cytochrome c biogenesis protein CcsA [Acidobacteriales bacterium]|nr:cytochrome c biogenesis protein CcsA [Terriglobales bacterium]
MPLLWLRIAAVFYGVGLAYTLYALVRRREAFSNKVMPLLAPGWLLHGVALVETMVIFGRTSIFSIHQSESWLGWLLMGLFLAMYVRYKTTSPGLFVIPSVFLLTVSAALAQAPPHFTSEFARNGWIAAHVTMILTGYAALFFSFVSSLLYLLQERSLKSKRISGALSRLPSLQTIDEMGYKALLFGFPFITLGLVMGSVLAQSTFGGAFFRDPKILLSLLVWMLYVGLIYSRWSSGWRGRKAAYFATSAFVAAVCAFAANFVSGVHRFVRP